ncbi:uncharacterized protein I206_107753 [Kwoniella pini CBS 10737]|uniref:Uncharacterized protein n=1 Tax=Kwoniella pini CBS 10737 TaxID=1296096 RepID=A0A1B9HYA3_9TREE|nr:uncharacterized protein I206_06086 [Kwoniella pini CBS 10737]OCF48218.1 hypothetical protein I206_06086 [Kwoniella pini CBS 10737]
MAEDITSWIAKAIIQHDKEHGANYKIPLRGRYIQMIKFLSFRDHFDPHAEIRGVISDKTHWIRVKFDVNATDEFEEPQASLPSESLTSQLRAVFLIESFRINLLPPPSSRRQSIQLDAELPEVILEILEWKVINGDKNDPVFYEDVIEVSKGKTDLDVQVQGVLRKWWFGESNSSQSHLPSTSQYLQHSTHQTPISSRSIQQPSSSVKPTISSPLAGYHSSPAVLSTSASSDRKDQAVRDHVHRVDDTISKGDSSLRPKDQILLLDFLTPYIHTGGKKKVIPEWLFEKTSETRDMLDDITMFGLDYGADLQTSLAPGTKGSASTANVEGSLIYERKKGGELKVQDFAHLPHPQTSQSPFPSAAVETSPIAQSSGSQSNGRHYSPPIEGILSPHNHNTNDDIAIENDIEEAESEDDIMIKPRKMPNRKDIFDPLPMPSSSPGQDIELDHLTAEDEDDLSDYEKEQRRKTIAVDRVKTKIVPDLDAKPDTHSEEVDQEENEEIEELENPNEEHTGSSDENAVGSFLENSQSLSKRRKGDILVDDSDQSLPQHSSSNEISLPAQNTLSPAKRVKDQRNHGSGGDSHNTASRKRPRESNETAPHESPISRSELSQVASSNAQNHPSTIKKPKIEQSTPVQMYSQVMTNTQSTGKSSRKSFLDSLRFFRSPAGPAQVGTIPKSELESPSLGRRKEKDNTPSLFDRLNRSIRRHSLRSSSPIQIDKNNDQDHEEPQDGISTRYRIGEEDGLDDGIDRQTEGEDDPEIIVVDNDDDNDIIEAKEGSEEFNPDDSHGPHYESYASTSMVENKQSIPNNSTFEFNPLGTHLEPNVDSVSPKRKVRKLGDSFKLNFQIEGLTELKVRKSIDDIRKARNRKLRVQS